MKRINHQEAYSEDGACTNWAEEYFSRLRRAEIGVHHHDAARIQCQGQAGAGLGAKHPDLPRGYPARDPGAPGRPVEYRRIEYSGK